MMKSLVHCCSALVATAAPIAHAQFGSGIVFDPTQSAHAAQQILQANQLYTTTVETRPQCHRSLQPRAKDGQSSADALHLVYATSGVSNGSTLTQPANTYGNSMPWMNAASQLGTAQLPRIRQPVFRAQARFRIQLSQHQGQQAIAARGATVDLSTQSTPPISRPWDIRANAHQRETDISQLEAAEPFHGSGPTHRDGDAAAHQPGALDRTAHAAGNQPDAAGQALQQMVGQKLQQDNLKSLFQTGNGYQQNFNTVTPSRRPQAHSGHSTTEASGGRQWTS